MIGRLFYLMIIGVLLFTVDGLGQNTWLKTYRGRTELGELDGNSIVPSTDGGYVMTGYTRSNDKRGQSPFPRFYMEGIEDIFVIKINSNGDTVWKRTIGVVSIEKGYSITTTIDGGYLLTGYFLGDDGEFSNHNKGYTDIFIVKLNHNGEWGWRKIYNGNYGDLRDGYDWEHSITTTKDSGYVLTGWTTCKDGDFSNHRKGYTDIFVLKLNSNCDTVWKKTFGLSYWREINHGYSVTTNSDGGFVLTGHTFTKDGDFSGMNKGEDDILIMKLNSIGDVVWKKTYGESGFETYRIINTSDGGYVMTYSNHGDFSDEWRGKSDIVIMRLNSIGDVVWKKTLGGSYDDECYSIITTTDGGYVLTGTTYSKDGDFSGMNKGREDFFVIKLDSNGNIVWKKTYGGSDDEFNVSIITTNEGGFLLTGYTRSNDGDIIGNYCDNKGVSYRKYIVIKLNSNGEILWKKTFGECSYDYGHFITTTTNGDYVLTGKTRSNIGVSRKSKKGVKSQYITNDIFVMKLDKNGNLNKK